MIANASPRIPVCLCLDVSGSTNRDGAISALNNGVADFYRAVADDLKAEACCEIALVCFNGKVQLIEQQFASTDREKAKMELFPYLLSQNLTEKKCLPWYPPLR